MQHVRGRGGRRGASQVKSILSFVFDVIFLSFKPTPLLGQIQNLRFCDGRNLADIFSCPEFPVVRLDTMSGFSE